MSKNVQYTISTNFFIFVVELITVRRAEQKTIVEFMETAEVELLIKESKTAVTKPAPASAPMQVD